MFELVRQVVSWVTYLLPVPMLVVGVVLVARNRRTQPAVVRLAVAGMVCGLASLALGTAVSVARITLDTAPSLGEPTPYTTLGLLSLAGFVENFAGVVGWTLVVVALLTARPDPVPVPAAAHQQGAHG